MFTQTSAFLLTQSRFAYFIDDETSTSSKFLITLEKIIFDFHYWVNVLTEILFTKGTCAVTIAARVSLCVLVICAGDTSMVTLLFTSCRFLPVSNRFCGGYPKKSKSKPQKTLSKRTQPNSLAFIRSLHLESRTEHGLNFIQIQSSDQRRDV